MRDFKNIDRIFQENLKDFEVFPPIKSWDAIENRMNGTPNKRRVPFWLRISSIAALLVLFFSIGTIYLIPENNFTKNLLNKNRSNTKDLDTTTEINKEQGVTKISNSRNNTSIPLENKVIVLNSNESDQISNASESSSFDKSNENTVKQKSLNRFALTDTKNLPFESSKKDISPKVSESKFTVATIFAPIYFNSFGDGSGADSQFNNNPTNGGASYSYGVKFAYKLNSKISVQSGVSMINLGQTTNDVYITPGVAVISLSNISSFPSSAKSGNLSKESIDIANENSANLNQVFGYVEIPVEIKYNVAEGKVGVNIVGGFSTLLLNKDELFVETNTFSQSLGNSNNLRSVNFSGNFGVDVDYSIYKNLFINVSPMFKVQTNTFSKNSGSIQSYYLGVYTGLNYKF